MNATKTVLIADDEERVLQTLAKVLTLMNYIPLTAKDGREAIQIYKQEHPDITLVDLRMPYVDGWGVLEEIRALNPEAEVIIVTGHGDVETTCAKALAAGASDFIPKPVSGLILEDALQRAQERINAKQTKTHYGSAPE